MSKDQSKKCEKCHAIFHRIDFSNDRRWALTVKCPDCRSHKKIDHRPGFYEVNHPVIDAFLYGRPA